MVKTSLASLARRRGYVVPRFADFLMTNIARVLPRPAVARTSERILRPRQLPRLAAKNGAPL